MCVFSHMIVKKSKKHKTSTLEFRPPSVSSPPWEFELGSGLPVFLTTDGTVWIFYYQSHTFGVPPQVYNPNGTLSQFKSAAGTALLRKLLLHLLRVSLEPQILT